MIEWKHQQIAESVRLLKKCEGSIYPFVHEREVRMRDLWTAWIGPYYVWIWSGDLFYTIQIDNGIRGFVMVAVDLDDSKQRAILWIQKQVAKLNDEIQLSLANAL